MSGPRPETENVEIARYPTIESPTEVSPAETFTVQVSLTKEQLTPAARTENAGPGSSVAPTGLLRSILPKREVWTIDVVMSSNDFELAEGSDSASISLPKDGDSTPARFRVHLRAASPPPRSSDLRFTLWFEGRYLARAVRTIRIRDAGATQTQSISTAIRGPVGVSGVAQETPADITIFHTEEATGGKSACQFIIASRIRPPVKVNNCRTSAELAPWLETQYKLVAAASHKSRALLHPVEPSDSIEASALMRGIGEELAAKWVPREFWDVFESLRRRQQEDPTFHFGSIQIFTDHPLLPWELVIPPGSGSDSRFLGTEYSIARWHVNPTPSVVDLPPSRLILEKIDVLAPVYRGAAALPSQQDELRALQQMPEYQFSGGSFLQLAALMQNPPQGIVHFAGHGDASTPPNGIPIYSIALEDRILDLTTWRGMARQSLQRRPLYFFNACDLGQTDSVSNFVDGWAPAALDSGASGFIGGIWPLNDKAAAQAAERFYADLKRNMTAGPVSVAALLRDARKQFFESGDPTYLSYVFYGDVNLRLVPRSATK